MDTCTNSRTLQWNEHFKELMKHVTTLPVRSACKPCCREACFCKSVTEFMSVLHGQNIAKAIPQIPLCPTKPSYNPNSLDFELCWESLQQHHVQEPEAPCVHSPAVLQQSHGLKLGGGSRLNKCQEAAQLLTTLTSHPDTDQGAWRRPCREQMQCWPPGSGNRFCQMPRQAEDQNWCGNNSAASSAINSGQLQTTAKQEIFPHVSVKRSKCLLILEQFCKVCCWKSYKILLLRRTHKQATSNSWHSISYQFSSCLHELLLKKER